MSYQALARKWRPQTFRDIIGQETIVRTLKNALEQNRLHHAYLFSGVRGVGKTTTARILAKAINCVHGPTAEPCNECTICTEITEGIDLDVREIDAATYTQVDNVRELREVSQFQPARDRKRIFIIDEAHMLSTPAWNALLKLIEEPPPHVLFMMATTEMQKVPATILSRVQQFVFRKITEKDVADRLEEICKAEGIDAERAALELVARRGEGSARDALSLLDQVVAFSGRSFTAADVSNVIGLADDRLFVELVTLIEAGDTASLLDRLQDAADNGRDFKLLYKDFLTHLRTLLVASTGARIGEAIDPVMRETAMRVGYNTLLRILSLLLGDDEIVSRSEHQRLAVELAILKAATLPRLHAVEELLRGGAAPQGAPVPRRPDPSAPPPSQRSAPVAGESRKAAAPSAPTADPTATPSTEGGFRDRFTEAVRAQKKMTAGYLTQAKSLDLDGATVRIAFGAAQSFPADYLRDAEQIAMLSKIATETAGRPVDVVIAVEATEEKPAPKPNAGVDDPVLKALSKHLGAEVVPQRSRTEGS